MPLLFLLLFLQEIARVYLVMPFPGSQELDLVQLAYGLDRYAVVIRLVLLGSIGALIWHRIRTQQKVRKIWLGVFLTLYALLFFGIHTQMTAESMFKEPIVKRFRVGALDSAQAEKIVMGIVINGESAAYPIQYLGYHHQVRDTVGGESVLVTYCTVCRTGRVYSLLVDGKTEVFRLVGMDHFNAMFEDATTGSWWRQATGECIAGPLQGKTLETIPSQQMSLGAWMTEHPESKVMQPDPNFAEQYGYMTNYESGRSKGDLTRRDSASWQRKSWVIGVIIEGAKRTYDWNDLVRKRIITHDVDGMPFVLTIEPDNKSFHAFNTSAGSERLRFVLRDSTTMTDAGTGSLWTLNGVCIEGAHKGMKLVRVQAYQEYLHSWEQFHPESRRVVEN
jgi:hypothetical protein